MIEQTAAFENDRQKVEVSVVKQDAENETVVAGAEFGLYAKEDILAHGEVVVKADTLLGKQSAMKMGRQCLNLIFIRKLLYQRACSSCRLCIFI